MTALEVTDLSVHIGATRILDRVTFALRPGERVGLIGESGSGKSMTALALLGLLPEGGRAEGSVQLQGEQMLGRRERELARLRGDRIAMVFQEPMTALDPVMRVGDQVAEAVRLHQAGSRSAARAAALDLLQAVHLPDAEDRFGAYPHQLSGGQRQRVVLAMAIANDPAVLICDEPTTALDVTVQAHILDLVVELVRTRHEALLFITHDLAVVSQVCERVLVMYGGYVVEAGPVEQVFRSPQHPYTAGLLRASDVETVPRAEALATVAGSVPSAGRFPSGCVFRDRCPREVAACTQMPALVPTAAGDDRLLACHNPLGLPS